MKKNQDNNNTSHSLEGKSLEDLWKIYLGEEELEKEKAKYEARKLKSDYQEEAINLVTCSLCGSDDVPNVLLDIPLKSNNKRLLSVKVYGAQCSNPDCLEQYYDSYALDAIKDIEYWLNMREHHDRIVPFHLLSKEARESIARAMRDDDDDEE
ncbi:hypothetical protein ACFOLF_06235 [Paenibacillus sepulcri]|uniref:Phage protein n=1 Tax=Paenibacillus sepulcri TaxID=359917 RepID=A0ABS7BXE9_9BACL|nr:hypothetical protein [Paenibacillus sepulcri]